MIPGATGCRASFQAMKSGPVVCNAAALAGDAGSLLGAQILICTLLVTASLVAVREWCAAARATGFPAASALLAKMDLSEVEGDVPPRNEAWLTPCEEFLE